MKPIDTDFLMTRCMWRGAVFSVVAGVVMVACAFMIAYLKDSSVAAIDIATIVTALFIVIVTYWFAVTDAAAQVDRMHAEGLREEDEQTLLDMMESSLPPLWEVTYPGGSNEKFRPLVYADDSGKARELIASSHKDDPNGWGDPENLHASLYTAEHASDADEDIDIETSERTELNRLLKKFRLQ